MSFLDTRDDVMKRAMWAKVEQHEDVSKLLKGTGKRRLVFSGEDPHWGIGHDRTGKVLYFIKQFSPRYIISLMIRCNSLYQNRC